MKKLLIPTLLLATATSAFAQPRISAQSIIVNPAQPDLSVQVRVDKDSSGQATPSYTEGERIRVSASTNRDAYVYLFSVGADGEVSQILPNRLSADGGNFVKANTTVTFPAPGAAFTFDVAGPAGLNKVLALASLTPLNLSQISDFRSAQDQFATVNAKGQDNLAQALSIVVNPIPQNSWVSDTAFFQVSPRAAVTTGTLFVGTNVRGSQVILNGRTLGGANTSYSGIAPGSYPVRVTAPGFADYRTTITIRSNTTTNLNVEFRTTAPAPTTPAPAPVTPVGNYNLTIRSNIEGARVFVDGTEAGSIRGGLLSLNLARGGHEVVLLAPGYRAFVGSYNLTQNAQITITPSR